MHAHSQSSVVEELNAALGWARTKTTAPENTGIFSFKPPESLKLNRQPSYIISQLQALGLLERRDPTRRPAEWWVDPEREVTDEMIFELRERQRNERLANTG